MLKHGMRKRTSYSLEEEEVWKSSKRGLLNKQLTFSSRRSYPEHLRGDAPSGDEEESEAKRPTIPFNYS